MKLLIAEKPSLMRAFMQALEKFAGEHFTACDDNEYYKSQNYYATAQFGHLMELKYPEEYAELEGKSTWDLSTLPFFPTDYKFKARKDAEKRIKTIKKLVQQNDVDEIIHCGDPAREGQILIDIVLEQVGNKKPVSRPTWKAVAPKSLYQGIQSRVPNEKYKLVHDEGMTRMFCDWDFGMNLSTYATVKTNARPALNVGRVIGAVCSEIYDRDMEIKNFKPEKYYKVQSIKDGIKLVSKAKFKALEKANAESWAAKLQVGPTTVQNIEIKPVTKKAPKLFSQTTLQSFLNKKFSYSPDKTLDLSQSLYEKGLITYPRTSTEYLSTEEKSTIEKIIKIIDANGDLELKESKAIFDNSKIEDHSALIITGKNPEGLTEAEMNCYMSILNRFRAVFCKEPCIYDKTEIFIHNPEEDFKVTGETLVQLGWQKFEPKGKADEKKDTDEEDETLPKVYIGQVLNTSFEAVESETVPPKHYTVTTLLAWMLHPFSKEDADDEEAYKQILSGLTIGTDATRAGILDKAIKKGYIEMKKTTYHILPRGVFLVESCRNLGIDFSKEKTAQMGKNLKDISKGRASMEFVMQAERDEIRRIIGANKDVEKDTKADLGKCPKCGKPIVESPKAYGCSGWKEGCDFKIWKEVAKKKITPEQARIIIAGRTTNKLKGFKGKSGKSFSAKLRMKRDFSGVEFDFD